MTMVLKKKFSTPQVFERASLALIETPKCFMGH